MMPRRISVRTVFAMALLAASGLLALSAGSAQALLMDARRMAMGGVHAPGPGHLVADNPAYAAVPARPSDWGGSIPLPLGLFTLFHDTQELNPDDDAFDPVRLANLISNPPLHLELRKPDPLDGDVTIDVGQEHLRVYWEDAHLILPQDPVDTGTRLDQYSVGLGGPVGETGRWRLQVNPYLDLRLETALDDAFYGLLAGGDSLKPSSRYAMDGDMAAAGGLAWKLLWARRVNREAAPRDVYIGVAPKLLTGFGMAVGDIDVAVLTGDSLFASETLDVEQLSHLRSGAGFAPGVALDLGVLLRQGPWDLGVGVRDIAGSMRFGDTTLEQQELVTDDVTGDSETVTTTLAEGESYTYHLDALWTFSAAYAEGPMLLLGEWRVRPWANSLHLGGEYRVGDRALRAGTSRDARSQWQFSTGVGRQLGGVSLDLALETHSRYIQDERGLALGFSLSL